MIGQTNRDCKFILIYTSELLVRDWSVLCLFVSCIINFFLQFLKKFYLTFFSVTVVNPPYYPASLPPTLQLPRQLPAPRVRQPPHDECLETEVGYYRPLWRFQESLGRSLEAPVEVGIQLGGRSHLDTPTAETLYIPGIFTLAQRNWVSATNWVFAAEFQWGLRYFKLRLLLNQII